MMNIVLYLVDGDDKIYCTFFVVTNQARLAIVSWNPFMTDALE